MLSVCVQAVSSYDFVIYVTIPPGHNKIYPQILLSFTSLPISINMKRNQPEIMTAVVISLVTITRNT